ncbi:MAG: electron transfer flavoprotein subunit alpha/FixB family protein [Chlorobium sp.]|nr:MAG: electron transfer flavoprotein subunit alpha/FixB family protein [Chlorobium sp.]
MNNFLVFLEQREGVVKKASIDIWNRVQELAALSEDSAVFGILAGSADIGSLAGFLVGDGVIYHAPEERVSFCNPEYYASLVADIFEKESCSTLFFADTSLSRDLAPRLSLRLQASLLSGSLHLSATGGEDGACTRPVYSASAIASFVAQRPLRIYTLPARKADSVISLGGHITFIALELRHLESEELSAVVRRMVMCDERLDVAEAGIVVAGGRGVGGAEGFALIEKLALLLGGAVGASRPVVDEGWRPHAEQIGQTGKTVAPLLYIACGISGAVQHLAGIGSARTVVAINSDRYAPIFDVADFGIVGDLHDILPKLIVEAEEFLKRK